MATISKTRGYTLAGETFPCKEAIVRRIRTILYAYPPYGTLLPSDTELLFDLLTHHPDAEEKIGCGVVAFQVRQPRGMVGKRCFYLIRKDGSEEDFSFVKCITPPTPLSVFKEICRRLIYQEMLQLKANYFHQHQREDGKICCPITGQWVSFEEAHVDHAAPLTFAHLISTFIENNDIDVPNVELRETREGEIVGKTFAWDELSNAWIAYHRSNAVLRVVSIEANMSVLRRAS